MLKDSPVSVVYKVQAVLERSLGPLHLIQNRKRSIVFTDLPRNRFVKVYTQSWMRERASDEYIALQTAARSGIPCPAVVELHLGEINWMVMEYLSYPVCTPVDRGAFFRFFDQALAYTSSIHQLFTTPQAGHGWLPNSQDRDFSSGIEFVLNLIRVTPTLSPLVQVLRERLIDFPAPACHPLHRDLKVNHFLSADGCLYLLDWENASRAPAVVDYANLLLNGLLHCKEFDIGLRSNETEMLVVKILSFLGSEGAANLPLHLLCAYLIWASYRNEAMIHQAATVTRQVLGQNPLDISFLAKEMMVSF